MARDEADDGNDVVGGSGQCASNRCISDLNQQYPSELKNGNGMACKCAYEAFGSSEYCCSLPEVLILPLVKHQVMVPAALGD